MRPIFAIFLQGQVAFPLRIHVWAGVVQHLCNVDWIEQPHNVYAGQNPLFHDVAVLVVFSEARFVHFVEAIGSC